MPNSQLLPDQTRSRQVIHTKLGFCDEDEVQLEIEADDTEPGEVRLDLQALNKPGYQIDGLPHLTGYLTPVDAAILGHQLIESSRRATLPPKEG